MLEDRVIDFADNFEITPHPKAAIEELMTALEVGPSELYCPSRPSLASIRATGLP